MAQIAIPIGAMRSQFLNPLGGREDAIGGQGRWRVRGQEVGARHRGPSLLGRPAEQPVNHRQAHHRGFQVVLA